MDVAGYCKQFVAASLDGVMQIDGTGDVAFTNRNGCRLPGINEPEQSIAHDRGSLWTESSRVRAGVALPAAECLFEPHFTTKGEGKGTGLSLAQAYGLMRQSGAASSTCGRRLAWAPR